MNDTASQYPYVADLDAESRGWYALVDLVHALSSAADASGVTHRVAIHLVACLQGGRPSA